MCDKFRKILYRSKEWTFSIEKLTLITPQTMYAIIQPCIRLDEYEEQILLTALPYIKLKSYMAVPPDNTNISFVFAPLPKVVNTANHQNTMELPHKSCDAAVAPMDCIEGALAQAASNIG